MAQTLYHKATTSFRYSPTLCSEAGFDGSTCSGISDSILPRTNKKALCGFRFSHLSSRHGLGPPASKAAQRAMPISTSHISEVKQGG